MPNDTPKPATSDLSAATCSAYEVDDRGNVVDCYGKLDDGTWEMVARLDREAGPSPCNQLAWNNETGDRGIEDYLRANGYADELQEAQQNSVNNRD